MKESDLLYHLTMARSLARRYGNIVRDDDYRISDKPLFTKDIEDCNAVALLGGSACALVHKYWEKSAYKLTSPKEYLPPIVKDLDKLGAKELKAVIVGGDPSHLSALEEALSGLSIPIVARYYDEVYPIDIGNPAWEGNFKELAILPEHQLVILNSRLSRIRQLYPSIE